MTDEDQLLLRLKYRHQVTANGTLRYFNDKGQLHCDEGPAVIHPDGQQDWYQHGRRHRDGGPAIIFADKSQYWYKNGNLHRIDGPAITYSDGHDEWYINGAPVNFK